MVILQHSTLHPCTITSSFIFSAWYHPTQPRPLLTTILVIFFIDFSTTFYPFDLTPRVVDTPSNMLRQTNQIYYNSVYAYHIPYTAQAQYPSKSESSRTTSLWRLDNNNNSIFSAKLLPLLQLLCKFPFHLLICSENYHYSPYEYSFTLSLTHLSPPYLPTKPTQQFPPKIFSTTPAIQPIHCTSSIEKDWHIFNLSQHPQSKNSGNSAQNHWFLIDDTQNISILQ